jgi:ribosomal protein S4E
MFCEVARNQAGIGVKPSTGRKAHDKSDSLPLVELLRLRLRNGEEAKRDE